ncbi:hypothetical protein BHE74_00023029, partial [Ensete ventricosum]
KQSEDAVGRSTKPGLMAHGAAARVAEESSRNTWDHPLDRSYTISLPRHQETNGLVAGGMSASCCLSERYQLGSAPFPPHEAVISKHSIETDDIKGNKRRSQAECGALPFQSPEDRVQSVKAEEPRAASLKSSKHHDEKKRKNEVRLGGASNQSPASKDDYIHVRAKRGQATNSHSLAERVGLLFRSMFLHCRSQFLLLQLA